MAGTTVRVDSRTYDLLRDLARERGDTMSATLREAVQVLRRQRFADRVRAQIAELRADPEAWADYLAEGELVSSCPAAPRAEKRGTSSGL